VAPPFAEEPERLPTEQPDSGEPGGEQDPGNEAEREADTERSEGEPAEGGSPEGGSPQSSVVSPQSSESGNGSEPQLETAATDPLVATQRERDEYLELAQRTQADFENYRKRAAREAAAAGQRAKAGLVRELLPVVDNLERALASAPEGDPLLEGVRLVHADLVAALEREGVESFDPSGDEFDPSLHEALSTRPADGAGSGLVVDVVEKGYRLNDSVLRPARVIVSA
jgi:molecular chaperone GrpE